MKESQFDRVSKLLQYSYRLKDRIRTGWELRGISAPESVADHSWGTAFLVLLFSKEEGVDCSRALKIALVHDVAEAETGDIARRVYAEEQRVSNDEKSRKERQAMEYLAGISADHEIYDLWKEYEESETAAAQFVRDMNLIDMCVQALFYQKNGRYKEDHTNPHFKNYRNLDEFFETSRPRLSTETGKRLFDDIYKEYRELLDGQ